MTLQYSTWAFIADLYTPLFLIVAVFLLRKYSQGRGVRLWRCASALLLSTLYLYIVRFVDLGLGIWPSFNADYSTHTAVALVLVVQIYTLNKKLGVYCALLLVSYMQLMKYLGYHTYLDMITTSLFLLPVFLLIWKNQKG
ncbi:hypothetical protein [Vibrio gallicus]|uniref:hypothetical protein n=1 Tax=Vibrio gallicus TaxID=190897 RepID=UPI0021C33805|nr:hypothetical protein [Vibrio gallicus]